jgi:hypothetical protein
MKNTMFLVTIGILIAFAGFAFSKSPFNISRYAPVLKITGVVIAVRAFFHPASVRSMRVRSPFNPCLKRLARVYLKTG